jgi:DHA3 family macrolide efflux protein-like MFS transporter
MLAATPLMVPEAQLTRIQGINQAFEGVMAVLAAPLGAVLLGLLPMQGVLAIDVFTALLAIAPLCFVRIPKVSSATGATGVGTVLRDLRAGLHYVFTWRGLALVIGMATLLNMLVTPAFSLLPLFVKVHLGGGAMQLGWLNALMGIGMLAGGILLAIWGGFKRRAVTSALGLAVLSIGMLLMGLAPREGMLSAAVAMFVVGLAMPVVNGPLMAMMQATVDPSMQGRVMALTMSLATAASPLALAVAGPLADVLGTQAWFLAAAVVCATMAVGVRLIHSILYMEEDHAARLALQEVKTVA